MSQPTYEGGAPVPRKIEGSRSPSPYPGGNYVYPPSDDHHYNYPPPPFPPPVYIGPPTSDNDRPKHTPSSENGLAALYRHIYDVDAFTPNPPTSSSRSRPAPPTITPHDWLPNGLSSYSDLSDAPTITGSGSSESTESTQNRPAPPRSAFMCFMQAQMGDKDNANEAAEAWKHVSKEERSHWESVADNDRKRYNKEREEYNPTVRKVRRKKDPNAPKRPMSAFLMYAQKKRQQLQSENPDIPNSDISRLLGEHWRRASPEEKAPFLERELIERKHYKAKMERYKCDQKVLKSFAPKVNITRKMASASMKERYDDQRQDEVSVARGEGNGVRYAPAPNINEFGAFYPVEGAHYHYPSPYGYNRGGMSPPPLPPTEEKTSSEYWGNTAFDSGIQYSYPRPEEEGKK